MSIKKLLISYFIACLSIGILSLPFIPGPNGSAILLLIPLVLSFIGPISFIFIGQYIPISIAIFCFIVGATGVFLAIYGYRNKNINLVHAGNGLWAISGSSIIVIGLIASCC